MSKSSYKVMKQIALGVIVSCGLSGVSHAQSNSTTEMYYIFDIKTTASAQEVVKYVNVSVPISRWF